MEENKELKSTVTISKAPSYDRHKILINLDPERDAKFNQGEQIEVTEDELKMIGKHRWLIRY